MRQLSFLEQRPLFQEGILRRFSQDLTLEGIPESARINAWIRGWLLQTRSRGGKETALEQSFNNEFVCQTLGYRLYPGDGRNWTAWPKPPTSITGLSKEPDLLLGNFSEDDRRFEPLVVVELKKPWTALDAPQSGRENKSAIDQAFEYALGLSSCRSIIATDMREIRLYSSTSRDSFIEFHLPTCSNGPQLTDDFTRMYFLLRAPALIEGGEDSTVARLLAASSTEQLSIQSGFYQTYSDIRLELLKQVENWVQENGLPFDKRAQILAVQRLLDRMLFIYFCEDHPDRLLQRGLVKKVTEAALNLPGGSKVKVYTQLKRLFRDLDEGVSTDDWTISRYNGELFKLDDIIDVIDLSDSLHKKTFYRIEGSARKPIRGVWGLDVFDFWRELDKDLLGNVFERSISDIAYISDDEQLIHETIRERKELGVYYTSGRLAKFLSESVIERELRERKDVQFALGRAAVARDLHSFERALDELLRALQNVKVLDFACGSGVFLTSALAALLRPFRSALEALRSSHPDLDLLRMATRQSELLKAAIHGSDLLPQAVGLAKLALWLTAARINEPAADLSSNILVADSLAPATMAHHSEIVPEGFDLVIGNPPWGGRYERDLAEAILADPDTDPALFMDSWEVFLALAWRMLKPGGRFALVLPDTIFSADKSRIRAFLSENCQLEKVYALGPDWFGASVRMGTVVVQARKAPPREEHLFKGLVLAGPLRTNTILGKTSLSQVEAVNANEIRQDRVRNQSISHEIRVFCSEYDWYLMNKLASNSAHLRALAHRWRGDEMNADGLLWQCANCATFTVPGRKRKTGGYEGKVCPRCSLRLEPDEVREMHIVSDSGASPFIERYIDGSNLRHRYEKLSNRWIRTDIAPVVPGFKDRSIYEGKRILIRQAGVGIAATVENRYARSPQSIYIYKRTEDAHRRGYSEEYVLAALCSRTMSYYVLKRFGEVDPARAYAKLTHTRLENLPIPLIQSSRDLDIVSKIENDVLLLLETQDLGGTVDHGIEHHLRQLWDLTPEEGAYINSSFSLLPQSQPVQALFPEGPPPFAGRRKAVDPEHSWTGNATRSAVRRCGPK